MSLSNCVMCGSPLPDDQGSRTCSMCYGDIGHGKDGYYREWAERQEQERQEQERQRNNQSCRHQELRRDDEGAAVWYCPEPGCPFELRHPETGAQHISSLASG